MKEDFKEWWRTADLDPGDQDVAQFAYEAGQRAAAEDVKRLEEDVRMLGELADSRVSGRTFAALQNQWDAQEVRLRLLEAVVEAARAIVHRPSGPIGQPTSINWDERIAALRAALKALDSKDG